MIAFTDVIPVAPQVVPLSEDELTRLVAEHLADEDKWVTDFIARLAGAIRDIKH
jgi:hypothetical protein